MLNFSSPVVAIVFGIVNKTVTELLSFRCWGFRSQFEVRGGIYEFF